MAFYIWKLDLLKDFVFRKSLLKTYNFSPNIL